MYASTVVKSDMVDTVNAVHPMADGRSNRTSVEANGA